MSKQVEQVRTYVVIFAWLMGLLVATLLAGMLNLDRLVPGLNFVVALMIAVIKGALVVLFFMHVRHSTKLTWVFATAALLWLGILFTLTFGDFFTRNSGPTAYKLPPSANRPIVFEHVSANAEQAVSGERR